VFAPPSALTVGNRYVLVAGVTQERFDETQMSQIVYSADEGAVALPAPIVLPISTMTSVVPCTPAITGIGAESGIGRQVEGAPYAEDYECMLVTADQVKCTSANVPAGGFFDVAGPYFAYSDTINVDDDGVREFLPVLGNLLNVTGVLHFSFGAFRIQPRDDNDIVLIAAGVSPTAAKSVSFALAANPSRTPRVEYSIPRADDVELSVFDVSGRKIQTLARGNQPAGAHFEIWDGRDSRGKVSGAGVYFYRLRVGSESFEIRGVKLN
jgi:hypothetical protein